MFATPELYLNSNIALLTKWEKVTSVLYTQYVYWLLSTIDMCRIKFWLNFPEPCSYSAVRFPYGEIRVDGV